MPVRILDIRERTFPISRYSDGFLPSDGLTTSAVAVVTDVIRDGAPVIGFGFSSFGRFGQGGLIRERFLPRLLAASEADLATASGDNLDPFRAWDCMMKGEKPGGHGERCVAVGTLDMALWDAAAKIAGQSLCQHLRDRLGIPTSSDFVPVYAGGGYYYPADDLGRLADEVRQLLDLGYSRVKIKIGSRSLAEDLIRIETVLKLLPGINALAVDAMNHYSLKEAVQVSKALTPYGLMWFEDSCDPLDYETQRRIAAAYNLPLAAGEALFSLADARNLVRYAGLRPDRDVLVFDPVHCYGLPEFLRIVEMLEAHGWSRRSCIPHGGHLFSLQVAAALGLGGCESNPLNFQPFGGFDDQGRIIGGKAEPPKAPGIGFETRAGLAQFFRALLKE